MTEGKRSEFAREAVTALGYLRPQAEDLISEMLEQCATSHPRAVAANYRKQGQQLTADEKHALGIRSNGFLSIRAFNDLTEKGRSKPLAAHEVTLLRAAMNMLRQRSIDHAMAEGFSDFKLLGGIDDCPGCREADGKTYNVRDLSLPPPECIREACAIAVSVHIDWLADLE